MEKITFGEWIAPIVAVPENDDKIKLYGDYKVTVNLVLEVDQYPVPRPEDLFATLAVRNISLLWIIHKHITSYFCITSLLNL